jgi:hypothetical protein
MSVKSPLRLPLHQHNLGTYETTAQLRPWELMHTRKFGDHGDAGTWKERLETANREGRLLELISVEPTEFRV